LVVGKGPRSRLLWNPRVAQGDAQTWGTPAGAKAKAELPYKIAAQDNAAGDKAGNATNKPQQSVVGFDPQTNERVVVNANDPRAATLNQSGKVTSAQMANWGTAQNQFVTRKISVPFRPLPTWPLPARPMSVHHSELHGSSYSTALLAPTNIGGNIRAALWGRGCSNDGASTTL
jgi:hypothetical protein